MKSKNKKTAIRKTKLSSVKKGLPSKKRFRHQPLKGDYRRRLAEETIKSDSRLQRLENKFRCKLLESPKDRIPLGEQEVDYMRSSGDCNLSYMGQSNDHISSVSENKKQRKALTPLTKRFRRYTPKLSVTESSSFEIKRTNKLTISGLIDVIMLESNLDATAFLSRLL